MTCGTHCCKAPRGLEPWPEEANDLNMEGGGEDPELGFSPLLLPTKESCKRH